ncbi:MAG TPA: ABC-F family ATP-binding cassette domain-containing protein [Chitinophagaceae bacterium]|nr:ABC-F family ATP-binding cassette domain-containing protein [Chitinophagaceae bacterium]
MLIQLQNISFDYGSKVILENANWQIGKNERVGLIGNNGTGKSTLLKIINGDLKPQSGNIIIQKEIKIAYFHQDLLSYQSHLPIQEVAELGFENLQRIKKELATFQGKTNLSEKEAIEYSHILHNFENYGGYKMHAKSAEILHGLGFTNKDLEKAFDTFSGGWRMRVLLAQLILQEPDVLLLDEPTNHLDLPSIEWLEKYLIHFHGAAIIVSHDRYFLDRMVTSIVEVFQQDLHIYSGNYTFYEKEKALRTEQLERDYENQQKYIAQQERFVERFRAKASKAKQAQSIVKKLDKLERIELDEEVQHINFQFSVAQEPGKLICSIRDLCKDYGPDKTIFKNANIEINRGDKIALIGANGMGKSTLLKIIAESTDYQGERSGGHNVILGMFAQHQVDVLNMENSIIEELLQDGNGKSELELRQLLGCFLFTGDDVHKKIKILSGGEKSRVALAKVIAGKSNFLLLDEPTNHLDLLSIDMLIRALNDYQGTYIIVSHDRHFLSQTARNFWHIEDYEIKSFQGSYTDWEKWMEAKILQNNKTELINSDSKNNKDKKESSYHEQREARKHKQRLQKKLVKVEKDIEILENSIQDLHTDLSNAQMNNQEERINDILMQLENKQKKQEQLNGEYEEIFEELLLLEEE